MDIKARGVDPAAVKKIDELARKQNLSRNLFLVNLINNYAALEEFKSYERRYETVIDRCLNVIQRNSSLLEEIKRLMGNVMDET
jgi:predicted nucleotide-binding protein